MNIAMVSEHASPLATVGGVDAGGQNVHVAALSRALAERGHRVTVYTRQDRPRQRRRVELAPGVEVVHVPAGPTEPVPKDQLLPYMPDFGRYLAREWKRTRPDVVHAHFWMSGLAALVGAKAHQIPVVQTFHALGTVKRRHQGRKDTSPRERTRLEVAIGRGVDLVLATARKEVAELDRMGVPHTSVTVVPSGVDSDRFTPHGPVDPRNGRPRLVSVGRLVERKGFDIAIMALSRVPDAELLIAGGPEGPSLQGDPEARRLRALADRFGVGDRVVLTGQVGRADMPALLRSADAVVCTPWYEPFGMVAVEAMACGVPVVAAAVGGLVDTVTDGVTGLLVPPRRPAELAAALRALLADPVRRASYGTGGADRARVRYAWPRIAAETEAAYERVLAATSTELAS